MTALGVALPSTLELLQRRSAARFERTLSVLVPPHQQMMADLVSEVAISLYLPYISPISPLYLPYISPISPYISPHLPYLSPDQVAIVRAPDGVELRLTHRSALLSTAMEADWQLDEQLEPTEGARDVTAELSDAG